MGVRLRGLFATAVLSHALAERVSDAQVKPQMHVIVVPLLQEYDHDQGEGASRSRQAQCPLRIVAMASVSKCLDAKEPLFINLTRDRTHTRLSGAGVYAIILDQLAEKPGSKPGRMAFAIPRSQLL